MISSTLLAMSLATCLQDQAVVPPAPAAETLPVAPAPADAAPAPAPTPAPITEGPVPYAAFPDAQPPTAGFPIPEPPRRSRFVFAAMPGLTFGVSAEMIPSATAALFFGGRLRGGKWALGYQFTGSIGLADRYILGVLTHRHHITALTHFGRRGFATVGAGLAIFFWYPAVAEVEARVGLRFGPRKRALFGGQLRLGHNFVYREHAPLPQLGFFFGASFL